MKETDRSRATADNFTRYEIQNENSQPFHYVDWTKNDENKRLKGKPSGQKPQDVFTKCST